MDNITLDPLEDLAAALAAVPGITTAATDPAKVRTPGVWVRFAGLELDSLGGYTIYATLHLIVADTGYRRASVALGSLLSRVAGVVDVHETVTPQPVILPSGPKPLPGLAVPYALAVDFDDLD